MQALILAGGKGTRLRPLTVFTPKPLLPICNRSLIHYQVEMLKRAGITDVVLSLSYQPNKIEQQLGDGSSLGVHIRCVAEHQPMGTSGALRFAESILSERAVVLNGEILTDLDLKVAIREHENRQSAATIVTALVDDPSEFGVIETDNENRITRFIEKPAAGETESKYVNAGTYILEPGVLESIPPSRASSFEYDLFPQLIS